MQTTVRYERNHPSINVNTLSAPHGPNGGNPPKLEFRFPDPLPYITLSFRNAGNQGQFSGRVHVSGIGRHSDLSDKHVHLIGQIVAHAAELPERLSLHGEVHSKGLIDHLARRRLRDQSGIMPIDAINKLHIVEGREPISYSRSSVLFEGKAYNGVIGWLTDPKIDEKGEAVIHLSEEPILGKVSITHPVKKKRNVEGQLYDIVDDPEGPLIRTSVKLRR